MHFAFCISPSFAKARAEDVFKSISDNVGKSDAPSSHSFLGMIVGAAGVLMLLALFSMRSKRKENPKPLNHMGKLLKELLKKIPLRPAEMKQLRLLTESHNAKAADTDTPEIQNPLVMILCPSLLTRSMQSRPGKVDKKVIAGLARKLGLMQKAVIAPGRGGKRGGDEGN